MFYEISRHIENGSDWKNFVYTCKSNYRLNTQSEINKRANHITTLLKKLPNVPWNLINLARNKTTKFYDLIDPYNRSEIKDDYFWYVISSHPDLDFEYVINNVKKDWSWTCLSRHKNLKIEHLLNQLLFDKWYWSDVSETFPNYNYLFLIPETKDKISLYCLTFNLHLTFDFVIANPEYLKDWSYPGLSRKLDLDSKYHEHPLLKDIWDYKYVLNSTSRLEKVLELGILDKIDGHVFCERIKLTPDLTRMLINISGMEMLFINPTFPFKILKEFEDYILKDHNIWKRLSENESLTMDIVASYPEYIDYWDWNTLCRRMSVKELLSCPTYSSRLEWVCLSSNSTLTPEDIINYPNGNWNWSFISIVINLYHKESRLSGLKLIFHPAFFDRWDWYGLSSNVSLTFDIVLCPPLLPKWNWDNLSRNTFGRLE